MKPRSPIRKHRLGPPRHGPANIPADEWRNPKYRRFLRDHGYCAVCNLDMLPNGTEWTGLFHLPCDPAHGPVNGAGSKGPDSGAIPLCRAHHDHQHEVGWPPFESVYGIDRAEVAAAWWKAFKDQR